MPRNIDGVVRREPLGGEMRAVAASRKRSTVIDRRDGTRSVRPIPVTVALLPALLAAYDGSLATCMTSVPGGISGETTLSNTSQ